MNQGNEQRYDQRQVDQPRQIPVGQAENGIGSLLQNEGAGLICPTAG